MKSIKTFIGYETHNNGIVAELDDGTFTYLVLNKKDRNKSGGLIDVALFLVARGGNYEEPVTKEQQREANEFFKNLDSYENFYVGFDVKNYLNDSKVKKHYDKINSEHLKEIKEYRMKNHLWFDNIQY